MNMSRQFIATYAPQHAYATLKQLMPATLTAVELREYLQKIRHQLKEWFLLGADTELLLQLHTQIVDEVLIHLWEQQEWHQNEDIALLAVGGYGRKALHPHSDIDIAIVLADKVINSEHYLKKIQQFMATLWDSKLKIGHSVRSFTESLQLAEQDLTIFTSLLENRLLCGNAQLAEQLTQKIYTLCSVHHFTVQKYEEYKARYARFGVPPYTLEPDIKQSPGGMRDIQTIEWLIGFAYKTTEPAENLDKLFIAEEQQEWLHAKRYLNTIRFARHSLHNHAGDQLIFDYQLSLGQLFGIGGENNPTPNKVVSNFMREYFLQTRNIARLTHRGLQLLHAYAVPPSVSISTVHLHADYIIIEDGEIKISKTHSDFITQEPWRLFEIFAIFSEHPSAYQLSVATQRMIEKYRHLIPHDCHLDPRYQALFLRILRSSKIASTLKLLHQFGLLASYITAFSPVTGMMQYDLFHAYPVDQHSLLLVQHLQNFFHATETALFPLASKVAKKITQPELLYLAGLFHDIGKGQGGHHEEIGAKLIHTFCQAHQFAPTDIKLMEWLVNQHLLLSHTAQHQDITNPAVIEEFAKKIGDSKTLHYLYLLTIADIYATNPKLWTAWRSSLIDALYREAELILTETSHSPKKTQDIIVQKQQEALNAINDHSVQENIKILWQQFNNDYFLSHSATELRQQANFILNADNFPVIIVNQHHSNSATEIFIYTPQHDQLFFAITSLFAKLQLSIVAAHINTTTQHYNLSTYIVLQRNKPLDNLSHIERVKNRLQQQLQHLDKIQTPELKHLSTRIQALNYPTLVEFTPDLYANCTTMSLYTADRPGLLAHVAYICYTHQIQILRAQINTLAERAEDIFWLLNAKQLPLSADEQQQLSHELQEALSSVSP